MISSSHSHITLSSSSSSSVINIPWGWGVIIPRQNITRMSVSTRRLIEAFSFITNPNWPLPRNHRMNRTHRERCWCRQLATWWDFITGIAYQISIRGIKFLLEPMDLSLEERDSTYTAINRISNSCLSFIGKGVDSILSLVREKVVEKLCHIACTKDLVNIHKFLRLLWWEVRCEDATWHTFPPQKLAGSTWRIVRVAGWSHSHCN